jgi:hypothetical protein
MTAPREGRTEDAVSEHRIGGTKAFTCQRCGNTFYAPAGSSVGVCSFCAGNILSTMGLTLPEFVPMTRESTRMFPVRCQGSRRAIPWTMAEEAYAVYAERYRSNTTLEHVAERGGFTEVEMDLLLPEWRARLGPSVVLRESQP